MSHDNASKAVLLWRRVIAWEHNSRTMNNRPIEALLASKVVSLADVAKLIISQEDARMGYVQRASYADAAAAYYAARHPKKALTPPSTRPCNVVTEDDCLTVPSIP